MKKILALFLLLLVTQPTTFSMNQDDGDQQVDGDLRELLEAVTALVKEMEWYSCLSTKQFGYCSSEDAQDEEKAIAALQEEVDCLQEDIKNGVIYSQEELSLRKATIGSAREMVKSDIDNLGSEAYLNYRKGQDISELEQWFFQDRDAGDNKEQKMDELKLVFEKVALSESLDPYIRDIMEAIAKMDQLLDLIEEMPWIESHYSLDRLERHKKTWQQELEAMIKVQHPKKLALLYQAKIAHIYSHVRSQCNILKPLSKRLDDDINEYECDKQVSVKRRFCRMAPEGAVRVRSQKVK